MEADKRLASLEEEFQETKEELKQLLLDMRAYLMGAQTPIPNDLDRERLREELEDERE